MFKTQLSQEDAAELEGICNLAPGDFRTVRQEMFYLGEGQTNSELIVALKEECSLKKDGTYENRFRSLKQRQLMDSDKSDTIEQITIG